MWLGLMLIWFKVSKASWALPWFRFSGSPLTHFRKILRRKIVRNPWGKGEIEDGEFDDDGPGWDRYPQIKALLNPVVADDGIFWVTKQEFFKFYDTIYVSASNMTVFKED